jgi:hypothetical protein
MITTSVRVLDLRGAQLAYWVAQAEELEQQRGVKLYAAGPCLYRDSGMGGGVPFHYRPDSDGSVAAAIIERERIGVRPQDAGGDFIGVPQTTPHWLARHPSRNVNEIGSTMLEAAMRAYVAAKFGDTVPHDGSADAVFVD